MQTHQSMSIWLAREKRLYLSAVFLGLLTSCSGAQPTPSRSTPKATSESADRNDEDSNKRDLKRVGNKKDQRQDQIDGAPSSEDELDADMPSETAITFEQKIADVCKMLGSESYDQILIRERAEICPLGQPHPNLIANVAGAYEGEGVPVTNIRLNRALLGNRSEFSAVMVSKFFTKLQAFVTRAMEPLSLMPITTEADNFSFVQTYLKQGEAAGNPNFNEIKVIQAQATANIESFLFKDESQYLSTIKVFELADGVYWQEERWAMDPAAPSNQYTTRNSGTLIFEHENITYTILVYHVNQNNGGFHNVSLGITQEVLSNQAAQRYQMFVNQQLDVF